MIIYDKTLIKQIRLSCRFLHNFIIHSFIPSFFFYVYTLPLEYKRRSSNKELKKKRLNVFVACNNTAETVFVVVVCVYMRVCVCVSIGLLQHICAIQEETLFIQLVIVEDALAFFLKCCNGFFF